MSDPIYQSKRLGSAIAGLGAAYFAYRYGKTIPPEIQGLAGNILDGISAGLLSLISTGLAAWSKQKDLKTDREPN